MRSLIALLLIIASLAGCQTSGDLMGSVSEDVSVTGPAASVIAGDMAGRFAEQLGTTGALTISIKSDGSEYALALEAALKGWGYTVITDDKTKSDAKPIDVAWSLDTFDGQVLARLTTPSLALGRAYVETSGGAEPSSPLSVMHRS